MCPYCGKWVNAGDDYVMQVWTISGVKRVRWIHSECEEESPDGTSYRDRVSAPSSRDGG